MILSNFLLTVLVENSFFMAFAKKKKIQIVFKSNVFRLLDRSCLHSSTNFLSMEKLNTDNPWSSYQFDSPMQNQTVVRVLVINVLFCLLRYGEAGEKTLY